MTTAHTARRKAARRGRRSSVGDDPARLVGHHPSLTARLQQRLDALSPRPATLRLTSTQHAPPTPARPIHRPTMPGGVKSP
jgi:hypothetical protein